MLFFVTRCRHQTLMLQSIFNAWLSFKTFNSIFNFRRSNLAVVVSHLVLQSLSFGLKHLFAIIDITVALLWIRWCRIATLCVKICLFHNECWDAFVWRFTTKIIVLQSTLHAMKQIHYFACHCLIIIFKINCAMTFLLRVKCNFVTKNIVTLLALTMSRATNNSLCNDLILAPTHFVTRFYGEISCATNDLFHDKLTLVPTCFVTRCSLENFMCNKRFIVQQINVVSDTFCHTTFSGKFHVQWTIHCMTN